MNFDQVNHCQCSQGVLSGLHQQIQYAQGKLVRVTQVVMFDVAVNLVR